MDHEQFIDIYWLTLTKDDQKAWLLMNFSTYMLLTLLFCIMFYIHNLVRDFRVSNRKSVVTIRKQEIFSISVNIPIQVSAIYSKKVLFK